jgi:hypothetical protein
MQQLRNGREPLREVVPVAAVDDHPRAYLVDLHAVPVEFYLVQPTLAVGTSLARIGLQGGMKRNAVTPQDVAV